MLHIYLIAGYVYIDLMIDRINLFVRYILKSDIFRAFDSSTLLPVHNADTVILYCVYYSQK